MRRALPALALALLAACASFPRRAPKVMSGLDVLEAERFAPLRGRRVGLITNRSGIDSRGRSTLDVLASARGVDLVKVFSPEHGLYAASEADSVAGARVRAGGREIPVVSLYAGGKAGMRADPAELKGLDDLVFDIQDVGARFYTYFATMAMAQESARAAGVRFVVLDRPDPINGETVEGPAPDEPGLVGVEPVAYLPLATRHGLTAGEAARLHGAMLGGRLLVVRMRGWRRSMWFDQTGLPWVPPSPNMPDLAAATLYPGVANLEFTNLSVGRGTPAPFGWIGAPWLRADALAARLNAAGLAGIVFSTQTWTPTKSRYAGQACPGVRLTVTDRDAVRPLAVFAELAPALRDQDPEFRLDWDSSRKLIGSAEFKTLYDRGAGPAAFRSLFDSRAALFRAERAPYLLYGDRR